MKTVLFTLAGSSRFVMDPFPRPRANPRHKHRVFSQSDTTNRQYLNSGEGRKRQFVNRLFSDLKGNSFLLTLLLLYWRLCDMMPPLLKI